MIIVVTGTPGVGKSTISRLLARRLEALHVDLSVLALKEGLILGWDEKRETAVADLQLLKAHLEEMASLDRTLVVEGHYAPEVVDPERATFIFVLRKDPWRLKEELEARGYGREKVAENVAAEVLDVCLMEAVSTYGEDRVSEIDVTELSPEEVVEEMLSIIQRGRPKGVGKVDWLSRPGVEQLLEGSAWERISS
ncbi:hypothetical protein CW700_05995 [Candidatus Bathyarchaeota archaeon]|nr:MAG: hypothetical protein CW700_05995 [Candidatus Bathyarchaeota archaeon]